MDYIILIAKRLRDLRLEAGLTQEHFAELSGFNYKFYQKLESGANKYIRLDTIIRLSLFWKMGLSEFFKVENDSSFIKACSHRRKIPVGRPKKSSQKE